MIVCAHMHYFSPMYSQMYSNTAFGFTGPFMPFLIVAAIWTLILKGFALWHAARGNQREWFVALLLINTLGILEIIYLVWFRPTSSHSSHKTPPAPESSVQV